MILEGEKGMTQFMIKIGQVKQKAAFRRRDEHQVQLSIDIKIACRKRRYGGCQCRMADFLTNAVEQSVRVMVIALRTIQDCDGSGFDVVEIGNCALELPQSCMVQRRTARRYFKWVN